MFSRFLSRIISGNKRIASENAQGARPKSGFLGRFMRAPALAISRLLYRKPVQGVVQYRFDRRLLLISLLVIGSLAVTTGYLHRVTTISMPSVVMTKADEARRKEDYSGEVSWLARYLVLVNNEAGPATLEVQVRYALANDSSLQAIDASEGTSRVFLAIRQLEVVDSVIDHVSEMSREAWIQRLCRRYIEASDILVSQGKRQDDSSMQDSLFGESIDFIDKGLVVMTASRDFALAKQRMRELAVRRAIVRQLINSNATLAMRNDITDASSKTFRQSPQLVELLNQYCKKESIWFDRTLEESVAKDPGDIGYYKFLLSHRDSKVFLGSNSEEKKWESAAWDSLPEMLSVRMMSDTSPEGTLLTLTLKTIAQDLNENELSVEWEKAANEVCSELETARDTESNLKLRLNQRDAYTSILSVAWQRHALENANRHQRWWNELIKLLEDAPDELRASTYLTRARIHLAQADQKSAIVFLEKATATESLSKLSALDLLSGFAIQRIVALSEAAGPAVSGSHVKNCLATLQRYRDSIVKRQNTLRQQGLSETDSGYRHLMLILAIHDLNHEIFTIELASASHQKLRSFDSFFDKLARCERLGINTALQLRMADRVATLLREKDLYHDVAMLYERLLEKHPKDSRVRNRCFDSWYRTGNRKRARMFLMDLPMTANVAGKARMLFVQTLDAIRAQRESTSTETLRERAESLQASLLEPNNQPVEDSTRQILRFVLAIMPPDGTEFSEYFGSKDMRDRLYAVSTSTSNNAWIHGIAYGLMRFETPQRRADWLDSVTDSGGLSPFRRAMQESMVDADMGRYWFAIRRLLKAESIHLNQTRELRLTAAKLAQFSGGNLAASEILLTIPLEQMTESAVFKLCVYDLMFLKNRSIRLGTKEVDAEPIRKRFQKYQQHLMESESSDTRFRSLISAMKHFYLDLQERTSGIQRTEMLEALWSTTEEMRTQFPWWPELLVFQADVAMETQREDIAEALFKLSISSGNDSFQNYRRLIMLLEQRGKAEESNKYRTQLAKQEQRGSSVWRNYILDNPAFTNSLSTLGYCDSLCRTHGTADTFMLYADAAIKSCAERVSPDLYKELLAIARDCAEAIEDDLGPKNLEVLGLRHRIATVSRDHGASERVLDELKLMALTNPSAGDALAKCYRRLGNTRETLRALLIANEQTPSEERYYLIAQCYKALMLQDETENTLLKAVALYPKSVIAKQNLAGWISQNEYEGIDKERFRRQLLDKFGDDLPDIARLAYARFCQQLDDVKELDEEAVDYLRELSARDGALAVTAAQDLLRYVSKAIQSLPDEVEMTPVWMIQDVRFSYEKLCSKRVETPVDFQRQSYSLASVVPAISNEEQRKLLNVAREKGGELLALRVELRLTQSRRSREELIARIDAWSDTAVKTSEYPLEVAQAIVSMELHGIDAHEVALERFRDVVMINPERLPTYLSLLNDLGFGDQSFKYVDAALATQPSDENLSKIGQACTQYLLNSSSEQTVQLSLRLLNLSPENIELLTFAYQLGFARGDHQSAAEYLLQINQLRPDQPLILNNLAMCLSEIDDQGELAVQCAERAHQLAANDSSIMDTLAVTYLKRNEPERAIRYLQDAIAIKKEPRYLFHLLMAYEKLGKEQEYRDTRSLLSQIDLDVSGLTAVERELYEKTVLESSSGVPQTVTASEAQGHGK